MSQRLRHMAPGLKTTRRDWSQNRDQKTSQSNYDHLRDELEATVGVHFPSYVRTSILAREDNESATYNAFHTVVVCVSKQFLQGHGGFVSCIRGTSFKSSFIVFLGPSPWRVVLGADMPNVQDQ